MDYLLLSVKSGCKGDGRRKQLLSLSLVRISDMHKLCTDVDNHFEDCCTSRDNGLPRSTSGVMV